MGSQPKLRGDPPGNPCKMLRERCPLWALSTLADAIGAGLVLWLICSFLFLLVLLLIFSPARRGRPPLFALKVLACPGDGRCSPDLGCFNPNHGMPRPSSFSFSLRKGERPPALQRELGKRVPTAACREPSIKRVTPAPLCVRKEGEGGGGKQGKKKKKTLQTNTGIARLLPEVPRSQEVPGAAQRTGQDRCQPLPIPASLSPPPGVLPPPRGRSRPGRAPGASGTGSRLPGARLRPVGSSRSVKTPACPPCGGASPSAAVDRELSPGTLKLTVGGKSSGA